MMQKEPDIQTFEPKWPDAAAVGRTARFVYDRLADSLYIDFYGPARPAASIAYDQGDHDYLFMRVDPTTEEVVGLIIEHFLAYAVRKTPMYLGALDLASLHGMTRDEVVQIQREMGWTATPRPNAESIIDDLARMVA